jgi:hypothetical protein
MAAMKTVPTTASVGAFLKAIPDEQRRADCQELARLMKRITRAQPVMWGPSIVGFGRYHYRYESGREGDWFLTGFSPRAQALTVYVMSGFARYPSLMRELGRHKTGSSCLYLRKLADADLTVLEELIAESVKHLRQTYAASGRKRQRGR